MLKPETHVVLLACHAMASRFEIVVWGGSEANLRAAGEEALEEIQRLEAQLSLYRPESDIADLNRRAAREPVVVEPRLFRLLEHAAALSRETEGAFDITVGPLLRAWGFQGGSGRMPEAAAIAAAREVTGMALVALDAEASAVRFLREGVLLDLGAIGKGYAIERAADILREAGVGGALLHGGTSTVYAVGPQPDGNPWPVAVKHPTMPEEQLAVVALRDCALSVSAVHGKSFTQEDVRYGHVLDPRSGQAVRGAALAAVVCPSATDADALSTALLVLGEPCLDTLAARPETGGLTATPDADGALRVQSRRLPALSL